MPEMLGTEVARKIKALRPEMRVILMSGKAAGQLEVMHAGGGGFQFLSKPFVGAALLERVRVALGVSQAAGGR